MEVRQEGKEARATKGEEPRERVEAKGTRGSVLLVACRAIRRVSQHAGSTKDPLRCWMPSRKAV